MAPPRSMRFSSHFSSSALIVGEPGSVANNLELVERLCVEGRFSAAKRPKKRLKSTSLNPASKPNAKATLEKVANSTAFDQSELQIIQRMGRCDMTAPVLPRETCRAVGKQTAMRSRSACKLS